MKRFFALIAACAIGLTSLALADAPTPAAQLQLSLDELRSRLNLTPEQQAKIAPFAEQRRSKMRDLHDKLEGATSRRDKRVLLQQARQAQEEFQRNVEPILTPEQQVEWKKIREEVREQLKERWHNRQS